MLRLLKNIRALGWNLGWRYWRIENAANKHPELCLEWADAAEKEAEEIKDINPKESELLLQWSFLLKEHYYHSNFWINKTNE